MSEMELRKGNRFHETRESMSDARRADVRGNSIGSGGQVGPAPSPALSSDIAAGPARMLREIGRALAEFDAEPRTAQMQQQMQQQQAQQFQQPQPIHQPHQVPQAQQGQQVANADFETPRLIEALMRNAAILIEAGESRLAVNILRNILMRVPDHPEALRRMGNCMRDEGRLDEALKCFRAFSKRTRSIEGQILVAETLYLSERDQMALAAYREVLRGVVADSGKLFEIYKNIGNIHVRAGDFEAAEEFYNKAYVIKPDSDVLLVNYGTLEIQRENLQEAVERFRRAVGINPENDKGWVGLAMVHRMMGDLELAAANIERALDINPFNRTALRLVVEWGAHNQNFSIACRRLETYIAGQGCEDAEMCFTFAKILTQMGRLREARIELERVLALDPGMDGAEGLARALDREIVLMTAAGSEQA